GSVVDASLSPLANVVVTLEKDGRVEAKATTDAAGTFRFANVAPGNYQVRAERNGFPSVARDVRVPAGVTALQLPIVLARAGETLPAAQPENAPKTTTATGRPPSPPSPPAIMPP